MENKYYLYVFDPSIRNPQAIKKNSRNDRSENNWAKIQSVIRPYRRGEAYFSKHDKFELLL